MVSNLVVRNKRTGYVTFVAKARVNGDSRTVEYICGLGSMTQEEFKAFQKWAHSMKDQEMRRARVLACPFVVKEKEEVKGKVAAVAQKKTTVKRASKKVVAKPKRWFPAPRRPTTHTEMMMERIKEQRVARAMRIEKARLEKEKLRGKKVDETRTEAEKVHKRPVKGLLGREREREEAKARRAKGEGFMFE